MSKPEESPYVPTWDETKLGRTKFRELMDLRNEARKMADQYATEAKELEAQMSALMLKYKLDATRVDGHVARWVAAGAPGKKLVPELVLAAVGGNQKKFDGCFVKTEPRAAYFAIYGPKKEKGAEE